MMESVAQFKDFIYFYVFREENRKSISTGSTKQKGITGSDIHFFLKSYVKLLITCEALRALEPKHGSAIDKCMDNIISITTEFL